PRPRRASRARSSACPCDMAVTRTCAACTASGASYASSMRAAAWLLLTACTSTGSSPSAPAGGPDDCSPVGMVQVGGSHSGPFPEGGVPYPIAGDSGADGAVGDGSFWDGGPVRAVGFDRTPCDSVCGSQGLSCYAVIDDGGARLVQCVECAFSP